MDVVNRGNFYASSGNTESGVLQDLEFVYGGAAAVRIPDWAGVGDERQS